MRKKENRETGEASESDLAVNADLISQQLRLQISHMTSTVFEEHLGRNTIDSQRLFLVPSCSRARKARVVAEDDECSYRMLPGTICVLPARRPFRFEFPKGFALAAFHFRLEGPGGIDLLDSEIPFSLLHKQNLLTCDKAWDLLQLKTPSNWLRAESLLREQLASTLDISWEAIQQRIDQAGRWRRVLEHLSQAPIERGQISELARELGVTRHHFSRSFQQDFGCSPRTWHRRHLSQRIVAELLSEEQPLAVIADTFGFSDAFALSRFVSASTGMSPRSIRRHGLFGGAVE